MDTFLNLVAKDLYDKTGNDMSRIMVVFPNKRAGLFFNEYLAGQSTSPIWSPAITSINELFHNLSDLHLGDSILLICKLYEIFQKETNNEETLDEFYFWGELLLNDFDDVDKNLVVAEHLFTNLKDFKELMDSFDFLDKEQEEAIQQFFQNFSIERRTQLKEKFISLWDKLGNIYTNFRETLLNDGVAYEGMIYRDAIQKLNPENLPYDKYIFVGFNLLNKAEYSLFRNLQKAGKALFYWDYDIFYTEMPHVKHEAGIYMNRNLKKFPSELDPKFFDNLSKQKKVRIISSPTENGQARFLPEWIRTIEAEKERENAVILCNESLLLPILHSIPPEVNNINITMGFPLSQTPVYNFINAIIELHTSGYNPGTGRFNYTNVQAVLKHPYTRGISLFANALEQELTKNNRFYPLPSELKRDELLEKLFTPQPSVLSICHTVIEVLREVSLLYRLDDAEENKKEGQSIYEQLYRETLFKGYTVLNRMLNLIESGELKVQTDTFKRLLSGLLSTIQIPFHGEPAIGMQIMGVLETRNLDFKNLILMSVNEGFMPRGNSNSSFIPYNLRKAFKMTTVDNQDAIYAYYFFRMIQRAENITLLYNTATDGLNRGEASRYILQFMVEWQHPIEQYFLQAGQSPQSSNEITVHKTPEIINRLDEAYNIEKNKCGKISPSALNTYLDCSLKFYYQYIARLKKREEITTEINSSTFGSIFHRAVELVYKKLTATGNIIRKEDIEKILHGNDVQNCVDQAFRKLFFHVGENEKPEYNGIQLINTKVIAMYVKQLLRNDLKYVPFEMVAMEKEISEILEIQTASGKKQLRIGGIIDRIDSKNGTLRIVDYKTGGSPKTAKNMEELFTPKENRPGYVFQTFLYASIMSRQQSLKVAPALLYIHRASSDTYSPVIEMGEARNKEEINDFSLYDIEFRNNLENLLSEIYNPEIGFKQTENKKICEYCNYKNLCKR